jgi:AraC family transcriptional regulator
MRQAGASHEPGGKGGVVYRTAMCHVRARRLSDAARAMVKSTPNILTVPPDADYTSLEALTRAFHDPFGLIPDRTGASGCVETLDLVEPIQMNETPTTGLPAPRIEDGRALLIAGLGEHIAFGNLAALPGLWQRFGAHFGRVPGQIGWIAYGVCSNTDASGFDYIAGVEVSDLAALPPEFARIQIAAQKYAVFTHSAHISTVQGTFMAIFNQWLPASGYQAADGPTFERYDERFDPRTGMGGFEIWVAIKE